MKRTLAIILSLVFIFMCLPVGVLAGEITEISNIEFTCDENVFGIKSNMSAKQVLQLFQTGIQYPDTIFHIDYNYTNVCTYDDVKDMFNVVADDTILNGTDDYYLRVNIDIMNSSAYAYRQDPLPTGTLNGVTSVHSARYSAGNDYSVYIYFLLEPNESLVPVYGVTIDTPYGSYVQYGTSRQLEYTVDGESDDLIWTFEYKSSDDTTISSTGLLSVADDETCSTLHITATSAINSGVSDDIYIYLCFDPVGVSSFGFKESEKNVYITEGLYLKDELEITGYCSREVAFEFVGEHGSATLSDSGYVDTRDDMDDIGIDIVVKATLVEDSSYTDTITIHVVDKNRIDTIELNFNDGNTHILSSEKTCKQIFQEVAVTTDHEVLESEDYLNRRLRGNIRLFTEGTYFDENYIRLQSFDGKDYVNVSDLEEAPSTDKQYYFFINVERTGNYIFQRQPVPDCVVCGDDMIAYTKWYNWTSDIPSGLGSVDVIVPVYFNEQIPEDTDIYLTNVDVYYNPELAGITSGITARQAATLMEKYIKHPTNCTSIDWNFSFFFTYDEKSDTYKRMKDEDVFDSETDYFFRLNLDRKTGYRYDSSNYPAILLNGKQPENIQWYSAELIGKSVYGYYPIDFNENLKAVLSVEITNLPSGAYMQYGTTRQITYTTEGNYDEIDWFIERNNSANTFISDTGLLTIGADETATAIDVFAKSRANHKVYDSKLLALGSETAGMSKFEFSEVAITKSLGSTFSAEDYLQMEGRGSTIYKLEIIGEEGIASVNGHQVTVSASATIGHEFYVKASLVEKPSTNTTMTVRITDAPRITNISLNFNSGDCAILSRGKTFKQVLDPVVENTTVLTPGIKLDTNNILIYYLDNMDVRHKVSDTNTVPTEGTNYLLCINTEECDGYLYASTLPTCTINGESIGFTDWYGNMSFARPDGSVDVFFPITFESNPLDGEVIVSGAVKYNETVSASIIGTNATGTLSYQWFANSVEISGATSQTYTIRDEDVGKYLSVRVSDTEHTGGVISSPIKVMKADGPAAPINLTGTSPSSSLNNDGRIGGVNSTMEYSYEEISGPYIPCTGTSITGLAAGTYFVRYAENNICYASASTKVIVGSYTAPLLDGTAYYDGDPFRGQTLTAHTSKDGEIEHPERFSYQWRRDNFPISGATGKTYTLTNDDVGHSISFTVTHSDYSGILVSSSNVVTVPVEGIDFDLEGVMIYVGQTCQLHAVFTPADATDQTVIFGSENASVATISDTGLVTGVSQGKTRVYVTDGNISAYCPVVVCLKGDVNGDNEIDMKDVLTLRKVIARIYDWDDEGIHQENADTNGDWQYDMKDILALRKYIANGSWT